MDAEKTVTVPRDDLDSLASAFAAMRCIIEHCDATAARHAAEIFERHACEIIDEADRAASVNTETP
ncbi:hypothetical protein [Thauera mechernichensis]